MSLCTVIVAIIALTFLAGLILALAAHQIDRLSDDGRYGERDPWPPKKWRL